MLTKKYYELIAEAIRDCTEWEKFDDGYGEQIEERKINPTDIAVTLSIAFEKDNPNFDQFKFLNACKKPFPEKWKKELEQEKK